MFRNPSTQKTINQTVYTKKDTPTVVSAKPSVEKPNLDQFNSLEDLEKLAALRDSGVITEEEFTKKKNEILGF